MLKICDIITDRYNMTTITNQLISEAVQSILDDTPELSYFDDLIIESLLDSVT
jgi:hypothetical protein